MTEKKIKYVGYMRTHPSFERFMKEESKKEQIPLAVVQKNLVEEVTNARELASKLGIDLNKKRGKYPVWVLK